jgi:hypothetical protein
MVLGLVVTSSVPNNVVIVMVTSPLCVRRKNRVLRPFLVIMLMMVWVVCSGRVL